MDYLDFNLEIGQGQGREYPVTVRSPAGEAHATMLFPFDTLALENRLKDLQIALLSSGGMRRQNLLPQEETVQRFGREMFDLLITDEVRNRYDVSQEQALQQGKGLRLKMRIHPPTLAALPWEYLYDERTGAYVCLALDTPIVRYLDLPQPILPLTITPPLRILGMVASPSDLHILDVQVEKQRVERAVNTLQEKGLVELTWLDGQTWRDLRSAILDGHWHIFHFVGHGRFDSRRDEGTIALADADGYARFFTATEFSHLLADHRSLRLVLLNSCEGARGSKYDVFSSTAATLVRRGIPAVVAMQDAITDMAAVEFARTFYERLMTDLAVDAAVAEARKAILFEINNTLEWGTPVLYMRAQDGRIFDISSIPREESQHATVVPVEQKRSERVLALEPTAAHQDRRALWRWGVVAVILLAIIVGGFNWEKIRSMLSFDSGATPPPAELASGSRPIQTSSEADAVIPLSTAASLPTDTPLPPTDTQAPPDTAIATSLPAETPSPPTAVLTPTAESNQIPAVGPSGAGSDPLPIAGATRTDENGVVYVYIPAGEFMMGSSDEDELAGDDEKPQHPVYIDEFWIMQTEVTIAQYKLCIDAEVCAEPNNDWWDKPDFAGWPVTNVAWNQAKTYAEWRGGRLPTEAEWEKACRGTDGHIYPWGIEVPNGDLANFGNRIGNPTEVGSYPEGVSPYGLYNMAGNVWEYTVDWYDENYYKTSPARNPIGPKGGDFHTLRGGSWLVEKNRMRCANRDLNYVRFGGDDMGFRVVGSQHQR